VAGGEFLGRPHVQHEDEAALRPVQDFPGGDGFHLVAVADELAHQLVHLGQPVLGHAADQAAHLHDVIASDRIEDPLPFLAGRHQGSLAQRLQVLGGVGDGEPRHGGELVNAALALRKVLEDLQPVTVGQGLGDLGDPLVERVLHDFR